MSERIAVRRVVELARSDGDLYPDDASRTTPEEGMQAQAALQHLLSRDDAGWAFEVAVQLLCSHGGHRLQIGGRLDAMRVMSARHIAIQEFKASRSIENPTMDGDHGAQLRLYAGLMAHVRPEVTTFDLTLVYRHPDTGEDRRIHERWSRGQATAFLNAKVQAAGGKLAAWSFHRRDRAEWILAQTFPFDTFRPHQRAMTSRIFNAVSHGETLLLEAPTGLGKSIAALFAALKAADSREFERLFFLTSRTTGAQAAMDACNQLDPSRRLRRVQINAKEKMCPVPGMPCRAADCEYARGYFQRIDSAVDELLARGAANSGAVTEIAKAHTVCPFELSLDAARWADVVVGDLNYVFDPVVRLQRFADHSRHVALIDEGHRLRERARDALSHHASRRSVADALNCNPPAAVARALRGVDRQLLALRRAALANLSTTDVRIFELEIPFPERLFAAFERLSAAAAEALAAPGAWDAVDTSVREALWEGDRWLKLAPLRQTNTFITLLQVREYLIDVSVRCLDPGPYLKNGLEEFGASVRFSGTLSPLKLTNRLHGVPEAPSERVASPYRADQFKVLAVTNIPTYLRQRTSSAPDLARLIEEMAAAPGNTLVAFPSFQFLQLVLDRLTLPPERVAVQTPSMTDDERDAYIRAFVGVGDRVGLVVLGGVFGESVDFSGAHIAKVVCIGLGLPPPSIEREAESAYFNAEDTSGHDVAYLQPAMTKVIQIAGRILRSPDDRGLLCLVDPRFVRAQVQMFFPNHWHPVECRAGDAVALAHAFLRTND